LIAPRRVGAWGGRGRSSDDGIRSVRDAGSGDCKRHYVCVCACARVRVRVCVCTCVRVKLNCN